MNLVFNKKYPSFKKWGVIPLISAIINLSACSTTYKLPHNNDLAIIKLVMPDKVINNLSLYNYSNATGNEVEILLDSNENKIKPQLFIVVANRKVRLLFIYRASFFDTCSQYLEFDAKSDHAYTIIENIHSAKYQDVPFILTHDCEFIIINS